jgi:cAMP-binding proteins - catabolite gene activator and regulatory subunit of cAMP-dependent protein kinases
MFPSLKNSPLFFGMSEAEISNCLKCSKSDIVSYDKDEIVFYQEDMPTHLLILLEGSVAICNDTATGKRSIIATFHQSGELFGEVYVFLQREEYDHYVQAITSSKIMRIPKEFFFHTCGENCGYHARLISNMLTILANKAYFLNHKVQILSCVTLRQKIATLLLRNSKADGKVPLSMNREELADYLNTARPSLSRELMNMQADGLIKIQKRDICILNFDKLQSVL